MLKDKVIVVTGAAGGIGKAATERFLEHGAKIVAADRSQQIHEALDDLVRSGAPIVTCETDIANEAQVEAMVKLAVSTFGRLDGSFNNAGVDQSPALIVDIAIEDWERVVMVNLTGTFLCMKHQIPAMLATGGGSIVNTSSVLGVIAIARNAAYTASKHGVVGLTRAAAIEYSAMGIRANALLPGAVETAMFAEGMKNPAMAAQLELIKAAHPIARMAQPREMADTAAWLLSDQSSFITGVALPADGGYTAA
jgi:NAD(P)-dependent dehydrogenase (short-subunit alcohol dehydrogenase family)